MSLKKPMLVLKKVKQSSSGPELMTDAAHIPPKVDLEVVGVIRHRILFKTRPKALISSMFFPFHLLFF